ATAASAFLSFSTPSLVHRASRAFCSSSLDGILFSIRSASSYKTDNLDPILFQDLFCGIIFLWNDLSVLFHGYPVCPVISCFQQPPHCQTILPGRLLSIYNHLPLLSRITATHRIKKGS